VTISLVCNRRTLYPPPQRSSLADPSSAPPLDRSSSTQPTSLSCAPARALGAKAPLPSHGEDDSGVPCPPLPPGPRAGWPVPLIHFCSPALTAWASLPACQAQGARPLLGARSHAGGGKQGQASTQLSVPSSLCGRCRTQATQAAGACWQVGSQGRGLGVGGTGALGGPGESCSCPPQQIRFTI
jgi:hypothetical protein